MRKSIILASVLALGVTFVSADLLAQRQGGPNRGGGGRGEGRPAISGPHQGGARGAAFQRPMGRPGGGAPGLPGNLELTDEQRAKVQQLVTGSRDRSAPLVDELQLAERNLRRELFADTPDKTKVATLSSQVTTLRGQISSIGLDTTSAIAALLTPEQREKVRAGGIGQRGGGRMGRGRG